MITTAEQQPEVATKEPGIYYDVPFPEYLDWPHISRSTLEWGQRSMAHLKAAMDGKMSKESNALEFGRAYHARLLEPKVYREQFVVRGDCGAIMKSGNRKGESCGAPGRVCSDGVWYCGTHGDVSEADDDKRESVNTRDSEEIEKMAAKVYAHPVVRMIHQEGGFETSLVWDCVGTRIKSRLDKYIPAGKWPATIVDLKKCRDASENAMERAINNYGYHRQAAMYLDAVESLTGEKADFILVCQEDTPPYAVAVYQVDEASIDIGRSEYRNVLAQMEQCQQSGEWPGYCTDIEPIGLPAWRLKQAERFLL